MAEYPAQGFCHRAACSKKHPLDRFNAALRKTASAHQIGFACLQPMRTQSTSHSLWHLRLEDGQVKHALFRSSSDLRRQHIYLDDDLTVQQLAMRRSLEPDRLELRQRGHRTWWRRDTLFWADAHGVHKRNSSHT